MNLPIIYALHGPSQKLLHINKASNGLSCNCFCLKCNEKLEAIQGGYKVWHYRHHTNIECNGAQETVIHYLVKQIITSHNNMAIPGGMLLYSNARAEIKLHSFRPDVTAESNGSPIYFEVYATHPIGEIKEKYYRDNGLKCIEIDLYGVLYDISLEDLEDLILNDPEIKTIIYDEAKVRIERIPESGFSWDSLLIFLGLVVGMFLFLNYVRKKIKFS